jgi:hypothetical protein
MTTCNWLSKANASIYNRASLLAQAGETKQGATGFADGVVGLIGLRVVSCETDPILKLRFENGAEVVVLMGESDVNGPEAFQYSRNGGVYLVEQNAV